MAELDRNLKDATVVITTPFHPAYMTRERIEAAKDLKLILTAGIGSDHIDLNAAADHNLTVAEVTGMQSDVWDTRPCIDSSVVSLYTISCVCSGLCGAGLVVAMCTPVG